MRVFKRRWRKDGKLHVAGKWTVAFRDHHGAERMVKGRTDQGAALDMGRNFDKLVSYRAARLRPDPDLQRWIETLDAELVERLRSWDVLSADVAGAGKSLQDHLEDYRQSLVAKGGTEKHADPTRNRIKRIMDGCGFNWWSDIEAARVESYLDGLNKVQPKKKRVKAKDKAQEAPKAPERISARSFNGYLQSIKGFARWMIQERRAMESPLAHLKRRNTRTDRRHVRRALTADECRRLLAAVEKSDETLYGMCGHERAMLYRLDMETGLRWGELRSLTHASFDLGGKEPTVTVQAAYSKHRRDDTLPLLQDTAKALDTFMGPSLPTARAFRMPASDQGSKMLRADLEAAKIDYKDAAGRVVDFHALRHTFITNLSNGGLHPKDAQSLARHSTITLTMDHYTHLTVADQRAGLAALPDLDAPVEEQAASATGTDDVRDPAPATDRKLTVGRSDSGRSRPLVAASGEVKTRGHGTRKAPQTQGETCVSGASGNGGPNRTRTCDQRIMSPLSA